MSGEDPFDLERFVSAQSGSYARALDEIRAGRKRSHWIWFVFPHIRGLGLSPTSPFSLPMPMRGRWIGSNRQMRMGRCAKAGTALARCTSTRPRSRRRDGRPPASR